MSLYNYDTIAKLNTNQGDKLAVNKNVLEISTGGFLQAPTRTVKNLIYGGYNRETVTSYLIVLARKTKEFANEILDNSENIKNYPNEAKQHAKKIKEVASAICSLSYHYRNESWKGRLTKTETCEKLDKLYDNFDEIHKLLKKNIKQLVQD